MTPKRRSESKVQSRVSVLPDILSSLTDRRPAAIGICFSMTDVFRSEILAVVMQQILDEPVLPTLFMRTVSSVRFRCIHRPVQNRSYMYSKVIQAVKTYNSLKGFVSTTLLSRLITKKIWTIPRLWEGFMRCAEIVA